MTDKQETLLIQKLEVSINLLKRCKTLEINLPQYEIVKAEQQKLNDLINNLIPCVDMED